MSRTRSFRSLLAVAFVAVAVLATAQAAAATDEPAPPAEQSVTEEFSGPEPAVILDEGSEAAEDQAWTFRYLVPTVLVLAVAVIAVTIFVYAVRVRGRYRVVS